MLELFSLPFMQRALIAGLLVGFVGSYYGVFIVQRGLSFMGDGLAHAAFGGVALGLLFHVEPLWVAVPFTIAAAAGMIWIQQRTRLGGDTVIGIFFAVSMALGIIFISKSNAPTSDAFAYLFGSILAVNSFDLIVAAIIALLAIATWPLWGRWAYATFDRELAAADRIPVTREDYFLNISVAVTVVVAVKIVGAVLIAAFLVIPAATARLLARTFFSMTLISITVGITSAFAGLVASYYLDLPSGAVIILLQAVIFFTAFAFRA